MNLPTEIIPFIFHYLSPCDLAVVAQINKTWKDVVYSNNCWKNNVIKLWKIKPDSILEFYHGLEIPSSARHIGEPTQICFIDWMNMLLRSKHYILIPFEVLESIDYKKYIQYFKQLWHKLNRPCIHATHHKWYDVYRGRQYLSTLSPSDQQRVFYRHCQFICRYETVEVNPYCFWLQTQISQSNFFDYLSIDTSDIIPRSDHPADIVIAKQKTHENRRLYFINKYCKSIVTRFENSCWRLRVYGKRQFDKKVLPWGELFPPFKQNDSSV
jgi:hypothetical protein